MLEEEAKCSICQVATDIFGDHQVSYGEMVTVFFVTIPLGMPFYQLLNMLHWLLEGWYHH